VHGLCLYYRSRVRTDDIQAGPAVRFKYSSRAAFLPSEFACEGCSVGFALTSHLCGTRLRAASPSRRGATDCARRRDWRARPCRAVREPLRIRLPGGLESAGSRSRAECAAVILHARELPAPFRTPRGLSALDHGVCVVHRQKHRGRCVGRDGACARVHGVELEHDDRHYNRVMML